MYFRGSSNLHPTTSTSNTSMADTSESSINVPSVLESEDGDSEEETEVKQRVPPRKKTKTDEIDKMMVNYLKQQRSNDDEVQRFMLSMVPAIRKLPDEAKEELMFTCSSSPSKCQVFSNQRPHRFTCYHSACYQPATI